MNNDTHIILFLFFHLYLGNKYLRHQNFHFCQCKNIHNTNYLSNHANYKHNFLLFFILISNLLLAFHSYANYKCI